MLPQVSKTAALAAAAALLSDAVEAMPSKLEAAKGGSGSSRKGDSKSVKCALTHVTKAHAWRALDSHLPLCGLVCSLH
jgi:hypothetical protein